MGTISTTKDEKKGEKDRKDGGIYDGCVTPTTLTPIPRCPPSFDEL